MIESLKNLPISERIQIVEDLWDSIAADQSSLPLTNDQRIELDKRLEAYKLDGLKGRVSVDVIADIRKRL